MMFSIRPKVPEDRNWTKAEWKAAHRYCRITAKLLSKHEGRIRRKADEALKDLLLYGQCFLHISPEEFQ
jgi:hypothetical protein